MPFKNSIVVQLWFCRPAEHTIRRPECFNAINVPSRTMCQPVCVGISGMCTKIHGYSAINVQPHLVAKTAFGYINKSSIHLCSFNEAHRPTCHAWSMVFDALNVTTWILHINNIAKPSITNKSILTVNPISGLLNHIMYHRSVLIRNAILIDFSVFQPLHTDHYSLDEHKKVQK